MAMRASMRNGRPALRKRLADKAADARGQMTVELCVVIPVAIVIAAIACNALAFFGECAEFDRVGRNAVRTFAAVPDAGAGPGFGAGVVLAAIEDAMAADNLEFEVSSSKDHRGYEKYAMTMTFHPTLFGLGIRQEIFGVPLPALTHESRMVVSPYKPGVLL